EADPLARHERVEHVDDRPARDAERDLRAELREPRNEGAGGGLAGVSTPAHGARGPGFADADQEISVTPTLIPASRATRRILSPVLNLPDPAPRWRFTSTLAGPMLPNSLRVSTILCGGTSISSSHRVETVFTFWCGQTQSTSAIDRPSRSRSFFT